MNWSFIWVTICHISTINISLQSSRHVLEFAYVRAPRNWQFWLEDTLSSGTRAFWRTRGLARRGEWRGEVGCATQLQGVMGMKARRKGPIDEYGECQNHTLSIFYPGSSLSSLFPPGLLPGSKMRTILKTVIYYRGFVGQPRTLTTTFKLLQWKTNSEFNIDL